MTRFLVFWNKIKKIGTKGVYNEKKRFEINAINQLSVMAAFFVFIALLVYIFTSPWGNYHWIFVTYIFILLSPLYLNHTKAYFWAKFVPIFFVQLYHLIIGINYGSESESHVIYFVVLMAVFLFFSDQKFQTKLIILIPTFIFPAIIYYFDYRTTPEYLKIGAEMPQSSVYVTYFLTMITSLMIFAVIFRSFNRTINQLRQAKLNIMNHNGVLRAQSIEEHKILQRNIHDLRSPVTSALELLKMIQTQNNPEEQREMMEMLERSLYKFKLEVDNTLDHNKQLKRELKLEKIDLKEAIEESLNMISHYPGYMNIRKNVSIVMESDFISDAQFVEVILNNILSNSVKYSDLNKKKPEINIDGTVTEEKAVIKIHDNGIGIAKDKLAHIFKSNFRATQKGSGSGLGLSFVKTTLEQLEGNVSVKSSLNKGSTFTISMQNFLIEQKVSK